MLSNCLPNTYIDVHQGDSQLCQEAFLCGVGSCQLRDAKLDQPPFPNKRLREH